MESTARRRARVYHYQINYQPMPRPKGLPKTGGRRKNVGNKRDSDKAPYIEEQENKYFMERGKDGKTQFERDLENCTAFERIMTHIRLMKYVRPELKAVDMSAKVEEHKTIEDTLNELAGE